MNLEIASRLVDYRKKAGLSQEELADKLGVSRQAVSKWERVEASPDTDNLIALAELYGITLDQLIYGKKETSEEKAEEVEQEVVKDGEGIHITATDDENQKVNINIGKGIEIETPHGKKKVSFKPTKFQVFMNIMSGCVALLALIAFLVMGFTLDRGWSCGWIVFLLIPIIPSLFEAIQKKKFSKFAYPVLVTGVYLVLGMVFGLWHPWWILFITIPVYYIIFGNIDKAIHHIPFDKDVDSDEEEND